MPYINVNITNKLKEEEKEILKKQLGSLISIIHGKEEKSLMIGINDGFTIYFSGERKTNAAYVDIKVYGEAKHEEKADFTRELFKLFEDSFNIPQDSMFVTISEFKNWGFKGEFF